MMQVNRNFMRKLRRGTLVELTCGIKGRITARHLFGVIVVEDVEGMGHKSSLDLVQRAKLNGKWVERRDASV